MLRRTVLGVVAGLMMSASAMAQGATSAEPPPKTRFVAFYLPGPAWDHAKSFQDQPGIKAHPRYLQSLLAQGRLVMGGPYLDNSNGGMSILDAASLEEARTIAEGDPTVKAGLLKVEVKPWLAAFSRLFAPG